MKKEHNKIFSNIYIYTNYYYIRKLHINLKKYFKDKILIILIYINN